MFKKFLKEEHVKKAHDFFERHGKSAIIFSRFIPIVRTFTPIVAGIVRMNYNSFLKYSLMSSFIWSTSVPLVGYFLGQAFPRIKDYLSWMIFAIILVSLMPAVYEMLRKKNSKA